MKCVIAAVLVIAGSTSVVRADDGSFPTLDPATKPVLVTDVAATSTYADKADAYNVTKVLNVETRPGNAKKAVPILWSAWCEGKPDEGIGETVTIHLAEPTQLDAVKIAAGVWRTDALFAANNQPTSLEVSLDGKPQTLAPKGKAWASAKVAGKVSTIAIKVLAVKKGKMNDTCISAVELMRGGAALGTAIGVDAKAWAALPHGLADIQAAVDPPRKGLDKLVELPITVIEPFSKVWGYGDTKPWTSKTWAELAQRCKAYDAAQAKKESDPNGADYVDPKGCPIQVDDSDDRPATVSPAGLATLAIGWPSHKELGISWTVHWDGTRWRLRSVDEVDFEMPGMMPDDAPGM